MQKNPEKNPYRRILTGESLKKDAERCRKMPKDAERCWKDRHRLTVNKSDVNITTKNNIRGKIDTEKKRKSRSFVWLLRMAWESRKNPDPAAVQFISRIGDFKVNRIIATKKDAGQSWRILLGRIDITRIPLSSLPKNPAGSCRNDSISQGSLENPSQTDP